MLNMWRLLVSLLAPRIAAALSQETEKRLPCSLYCAGLVLPPRPAAMRCAHLALAVTAAALLAAACLPAVRAKQGPIWSWSGQLNSPFWDPNDPFYNNDELLDISGGEISSCRSRRPAGTPGCRRPCPLSCAPRAFPGAL